MAVRFRMLTIAALMAVLSAAPDVAAAEGGLRYSITVTRFENQAGWHGNWSVGDAWGAALTDMLNASGRFIVLGEADMRNAALDEQDFATTGRTVQGAKTPVTGQMTPAQLLVKGAITHVQHSTSGGGAAVRIKGVRLGGTKDKAEINATIYVVDSTTGQVLASKSVVGEAGKRGANVGYGTGDWGANVAGFQKDNLGKAVEDAVAEAVDFLIAQLPEIPWRGSVVLVKDDKVYINRGTREGVSAGQVFSVGATDVIRDPDTGEILDESVTEVARLRVETVKEKLSICGVTSGTLAGVTPGMGVVAGSSD